MKEVKAQDVPVLAEQPISNVRWVKADDINPNDYNPNIVGVTEMKGLKSSLLNNGWVFPITINPDGFIIDGYHRYYLSRNDKDVRKKYKGYVPVLIINHDIESAICMTVTMNAAKGTHQSKIMHELVSRLHNEFEMPREEISERCTMTMEEVDLFLQEGVFTKLNIDKHTYSKGWVPKKD
jgi:hypothetical protein